MAFTSSFYANWETISLAAAAISVIGAAMMIMFSRLFGLRNLEQVAKAELTFAGSTVLIVIMVLTLVEVGEPMLASGSRSLARCLYLESFGIICEGPEDFGMPFAENTLIDWMKLYMKTPADCVQRFMTLLYTLSIPVEAMASLYMEIFMSEHASGFGVKWIAERITNTTQSLSFYTYIYFLLGYIFDFIRYYAGFFFSIGVALRSFPPTRGAGAYLMAMSFGLYFVFPLAYITIATLSLPHAASAIVVGGTGPSGAFEYTCVLPAPAEVNGCEGPSVARAFELSDKINARRDDLQDLLDVRINDFTKHLVSAICIFPMVAFVILLTFVLNTTNLFGGNIPEIGRGLVKLI